MKITLLTSTFAPHLRIGEVARTVQRHLCATATVSAVPVDMLPHSALMTGRRDAQLDRARRAVIDADSLVVITPRYEPAGSAPLRMFLGDLPQHALQDKPVLPIGLGAVRSQSTGLSHVCRPEATCTFPGCFVYEAWFVSRLGRWRLKPEATALLEETLATFQAASGPRGLRVAS